MIAGMATRGPRSVGVRSSIHVRFAPDCVAKVILDNCSQNFRAIGAFLSMWGVTSLVMNYRVTSVTSLRLYQ